MKIKRKHLRGLAEIGEWITDIGNRMCKASVRLDEKIRVNRATKVELLKDLHEFEGLKAEMLAQIANLNYRCHQIREQLQEPPPFDETRMHADELATSNATLSR